MLVVSGYKDHLIIGFNVNGEKLWLKEIEIYWMYSDLIRLILLLNLTLTGYKDLKDKHEWRPLSQSELIPY